MERGSETIDRLSVIIDNCDTLTIDAKERNEVLTEVTSRRAIARCPFGRVPRTQQGQIKS